MKKLTILSIFFLNIILLSQSTDIDSTYYYPLDTGNYWEYSVYSGQDPYHLNYSHSYWIEVVGDTVLENGESYKVLEQGSFTDSEVQIRFERIDSISTSVFRYNSDNEYKIDSLSCSVGDTINCSRFSYTGEGITYCTDIYEKVVFNEILSVKKLINNPVLIDMEYELAQNIGLIKQEYWEIESHLELLKYAIIKGIEYGTSVDISSNDIIPSSFKLHQNYPNPFNPTTTIKFSIPSVVETQNLVSLRVYNTLGQQVETLINKPLTAGNYEVQFNSGNLPSGIYYYRLQSGSFVETKKMILLK